MALKFQKNAQKDKSEQAKKTQEQFDEAMGAAQNCLNHDLFRKYADEYEKLKEEIFNHLLLLDQTETDPVRYGFQCKDLVSKLRHVGALLMAVRAESGK